MSERRPLASIGRLQLAVSAFVLVVPLLAVMLLRIYDTQLVRQTEAQLAAEAVVIGEAWRAALLEAQGLPPPATPATLPGDAIDGKFSPIAPMLDLNDGLAPPAPAYTRIVTGRSGPAWAAGERMRPILERVQSVNLSGARILDEAGCVVASSGGGDLGACLDDFPEVATALAGRYSAVARERTLEAPRPPLESISRGSSIRVFVAVPLLAGGRVIGVVRMSRTPVDPLRALWKDRHTVGAALLACLVLTLLASVFFSRSIARPLQAITAAAEAIAGGQKRQPFALRGFMPAELHALSDALDRMTGQLADKADYIADFAANTSHELKTPITGIRGAAELLTESWREMSDEERERFLGNIAQDAERLDRTVRRLLELARIQSAPDASEKVELAPFLKALRERYGPRLVVAHAAPRAVTMNRDHLESAVHNLVDNAFRHGDGEPVELTVRPEGRQLSIRVRDHGGGISEGNRLRLFQRFFTTERDRGGTGLGLSIVQAVAETRGGRVDVESGPSGTVFTLVV